MKRNTQVRRKSEILNLNNLHNTIAIRDKEAKASAKTDNAGAFSFQPAPPPPSIHGLGARSKDTASDSITSGVPDMQSAVAAMTDRIDMLAANQNDIRDSLESLESKLDRLLSQQGS